MHAPKPLGVFQSLFVAGVLLAFPAALLAQMSPEEAQQRMQERIAQEQMQAQREAVAATQPSNLTNGEVAALRKTIAQQQYQITKLTAEIQQMKDKLTAEFQSQHNAPPLTDNAAPATNAPTADIDDAIAHHTLADGMTLVQAESSLSVKFIKLREGSDGQVYEAATNWKETPIGSIGGVVQTGGEVSEIKYTLLVKDGVIVNWSSSPFSESSGRAYSPPNN